MPASSSRSDFESLRTLLVIWTSIPHLTEAENCPVAQRLTGRDARRWETRLVWCIGKTLGLETKSRAGPKWRRHVICRIELQTVLRCAEVHLQLANRRPQLRGQSRLPCCGTQHVVVIEARIAKAQTELDRRVEQLYEDDPVAISCSDNTCS